MEWTDDGIILGLRRHGEGHAVVELITAEHGRHLGLVYGGGSRKKTPLLQPGNSVRAVWRARLDEQLGNYTLEITQSRADRMMMAARASFGLQTIAALLRLLPERDPHGDLFVMCEYILDRIDEPEAASLIARFELQLLAELGFGLDLSSCAATGVTKDLIYVSPKSGRAVCRAAGEEWRERLLPLPSFLREVEVSVSPADIAAAFALTGHFLTVHVLEPRGMELPEARGSLLAAAKRMRAA
jgi:DNA repair protein RecO (recombination protein O)